MGPEPSQSGGLGPARQDLEGSPESLADPTLQALATATSPERPVAEATESGPAQKVTDKTIECEPGTDADRLAPLELVPLPKRAAVYLGKLASRVRQVGLLALAGIALAFLGLYFDHYNAKVSSKEQQTVLAEQESTRTAISEIPQATAQRVAELIGVQAALRESGPLRDLADLARTADADKMAANTKVNSGNPLLQKAGAEDLRAIAQRRSSALESLSAEAAEDFRQAGGAFLVAHELTQALDAYLEAARLQPAFSPGQVTLSELALQAGNLPLAERAATDALAAAARSEFKDWETRFAMRQLALVHLAQKDLAVASRVIDELEATTRASATDADTNRGRYGKLEEYGLERPLISRDNSVTFFYDGSLLTTYAFIEPAELSEAKYALASDVMKTDAISLIARYQLMETLTLRGKLLVESERLAEAAAVFQEGLLLARRQVREVGIPGVEVFVAEYLEYLGHVREAEDERQMALRHYEESYTLRRQLMKLIEGNEEAAINLARYARSLASVLERISLLRDGGGELDGALEAIDEAVRTRRLVFQKTGLGQDRALLAASMFIRGGQLAHAGRPDEACKVLVEVREFLADSNALDGDREAADTVQKSVSDLVDSGVCSTKERPMAQRLPGDSLSRRAAEQPGAARVFDAAGASPQADLADAFHRIAARRR